MGNDPNVSEYCNFCRPEMRQIMKDIMKTESGTGKGYV
jgi:hypothetical protein